MTQAVAVFWTSDRVRLLRVREGPVCGRGVCLLKERAEGTYKTKHAEAARLYYTTTLYTYTNIPIDTRIPIRTLDFGMFTFLHPR